MQRPDVGHGAAMWPLELVAFDDERTPYEIRPCEDCLPWYAEVVKDEDGEPFVREWHAIDCPVFRGLEDDPAGGLSM